MRTVSVCVVFVFCLKEKENGVFQKRLMCEVEFFGRCLGKYVAVFTVEQIATCPFSNTQIVDLEG